jgi:hypothetical protein
MHDDDPAHFSRAVRDDLNNTYHDLWMGRGGPAVWPPCSSDLNPLEFYLWEHIKTLVTADPVDNEEALYHHIVDVCQIISNSPGIFKGMQGPMRRIEGGLIEAIFSTYYKSTLSAISPELSISGYMSIWTFLLVLVCGICPHVSVISCISAME